MSETSSTAGPVNVPQGEAVPYGLVAGSPDNPYPVGSKNNPNIVGRDNSQAGLASLKVRLGGPAPEATPATQSASPAEQISAGAEAVGLPATLPGMEPSVPEYSLGSMHNPSPVGGNSQAGLASARVRLGGPESAPTTSSPVDAEEVKAQAADISAQRLEGQA